MGPLASGMTQALVGEREPAWQATDGMRAALVT